MFNLWIAFRFWPLLLPIAIGIFVFVADEPLWKKIGLILLPSAIVAIGYFSSSMYINFFCIFANIALFIILLIYYRNRGVI
jgi:hypothetical protein